MENFKFGVLNYERTFQNHKSRLNKYHEACDLDDKLRYGWDDTSENFAELVIHANAHNAFPNKKAVRYLVNLYFRNDISHYLYCADLPETWVTAVYLDQYNEINDFMNEVANIVWERIK